MTQLPDPSLQWAICMPAVALIAEREGLYLKAYRCPAGVPTIGWGETAGVTMGMTWTKAQADQRLCDELARYSEEVRKMCANAPSEDELGAMVSLAYNIGLEAFGKSTVLACHNKGDLAGAARAFGLWNKAKVNGVLTVLDGLTARRAAESALYLTADPEAPQQAMPQAVAPESNLAASPINAGGAAAAASGVLTIASQYGDQAHSVIASFKDSAEALGIQLPLLLGGVLLVSGGVVLYQRIKQRHGGWA